MTIVEQIENAARLNKGVIALELVKEKEKEELAKGYRYIKLSSRTKVLVECDKKGKPTAKGQRQLDSLKTCFV